FGPGLAHVGRQGRSRARAGVFDAHHLASFAGFLFKDSPRTEIYTLSLHDALPISSLRMCVENITVLPSCFNPRMMSRTSRRPMGSSPDIGSSRITTFGSCRMA